MAPTSTFCKNTEARYELACAVLHVRLLACGCVFGY